MMLQPGCVTTGSTGPLVPSPSLSIAPSLSVSFCVSLSSSELPSRLLFRQNSNLRFPTKRYAGGKIMVVKRYSLVSYRQKFEFRKTISDKSGR